MDFSRILTVAVVGASLFTLSGATSAQAQRADKAPDGRKLIRAKGTPGTDTFPIKEPERNLTLEDMVIQASGRTAMIFYDKRGAHENVVLRNLLIHVAPKTIALDRSYWGVRGYNMVDTTIDNCEITGFGKVTEKHDEGHALYLNLWGDLSITDSFIHHNGGQGLQLVNRPKESSFPPGPAPGRIFVRNTRFHENGFNPDRGGFQISIFGTGQAISLEGVEVIAGFDDTAWPRSKTGGALVIEAEPYAPGRNRYPWWRPEKIDEDFEIPFTQGRTELNRVVMRQKNPDKPVVQIKGCSELIVTGSTFDGGKVALDRPDKPGRNCGRIVWSGNKGDAIVYVRGERIGPATKDFVIED